MSQVWDIDEIVPGSTSPATDIQRIIDGFNALRSNFSGAAEPATEDQVPFMWWPDTTNDLLKMRNAANSAWITVGKLSAINFGLLSLAGGNLTGGVNSKLSSIASAATPDIFAVTVGNIIDYTGTATCTGFAAAPQAGAERTLICADAAVFTAGANLLIRGVPSGQNWTATPGAHIVAIAITTTQFRLVVNGGGGAVGGGADLAFYENDQTINSDYTITTNKNAMSTGPITIASGVTVTVPSGSTWAVI